LHVKITGSISFEKINIIKVLTFQNATSESW